MAWVSEADSQDPILMSNKQYPHTRSIVHYIPASELKFKSFEASNTAV